MNRKLVNLAVAYLDWFNVVYFKTEEGEIVSVGGGEENGYSSDTLGNAVYTNITQIVEDIYKKFPTVVIVL